MKSTTVMLGILIVLGSAIGVTSQAYAQVPACPTTNGTPLLLIRNLVPGYEITGIWAARITSYLVVYEQTNLLHGQSTIPGMDPQSVLDKSNPMRCGVPFDFSKNPGFIKLFGGESKGCSSKPAQNIYKIEVHLKDEQSGKIVKLNVVKDICGEAMLDIVAGTPFEPVQ